MSKIVIIKHNINRNRNHEGITISFPVENKCPICNDKMTPIIEASAKYDPDLSECIGVLFKCISCLSYYSNKYKLVRGYGTQYTAIKMKQHTTPDVDYIFDKNIEEFSPKFKEIYSQALYADSLNLKEVSGIAFRKALEFLIKDYLIKVKGLDESKVSNLFLGTAVQKIEDEYIKSLADISVIIGNDETHYKRRNEDLDIEDLKTYIESTVFFISHELKALEVVKRRKQD